MKILKGIPANEIKILFIIGLAGGHFLSSAQAANEEIIKEYAPGLTIERVIQKSKDYAMKQGMKIEDYFIETIKYNPSKKEWDIFFMGKLPTPGNHFSVNIKDRTEEIILMRGE